MMSWVRQGRERQRGHKAPSKEQGLHKWDQGRSLQTQEAKILGRNSNGPQSNGQKESASELPTPLGGEEEEPTWPHHASPAAGGQDTTPHLSKPPHLHLLYGGGGAWLSLGSCLCWSVSLSPPPSWPGYEEEEEWEDGPQANKLCLDASYPACMPPGPSCPRAPAAQALLSACRAHSPTVHGLISISGQSR